MITASMLSNTFSSWFSSLASCCGSREEPRSNEPSRGFVAGRPLAERSIVVLRDQPAVIPRPSAEPLWSNERTYEKTLERERQTAARLRRTTSRDSSTRRAWFAARSSSSVRRLQISGPTDFRHLQSESFQMPAPASRPRPRSFRPIELSIYQPSNRLSPILPYVEGGIRLPPRAYTANSSRWDASSSSTLAGDRSQSTLSFHVPRRHVRQRSSLSIDSNASPPRIPPKSRARASALPAHNRIVERIASAIIEKDRLQAEINSLVERQSIYINSRPSTGYDMRGESDWFHPAKPQLTPTGFEPMPSIPALPAAAPSFAERLSVDDRPRTAPPRTHAMSVQEKTLELALAAQSQPQLPYHASRSDVDATHDAASDNDDEHLHRPLAPPLPLVLRPPLRKKKSFSRVSSWLSTSSPHTPAFTTTTTTTNSPRPIKESDGFYQCLAPPEGLPRTSMETSSSVYTWETGQHDDEDDDDDEETKTVPTTAAAWSPEQTPKQQSRHTTPVIGYGRGGGFDKETMGGLQVQGDTNGPRPTSVGVAF